MNSKEIYHQTIRHFLNPILPLLDDDSVSEIMIVGHKNVYCERQGKVQRQETRFSDESSLMAAVRNIAEFVGRSIGDDRYSTDGRLPSGERVHAIIPPASRQGICLTIRKFQRCFFDIDHLISTGSLNRLAAEFLKLSVMLHKNIVVSGGTGTGKTTMLNVLSTAIPSQERIIVIEDSSELQLQQPHVVYLEAQPANPGGQGGFTIRDLFVDSLRMRPDRIIVGEVRRGEALDLIQSMISGHSGSLTTVHADNPRNAVSRLETLCLLSDADLPVHVARSQVASAVHLVVQLTRFADGSRRVSNISECVGLDANHDFVWNPIFEFEGAGLDDQGYLQGELVATGAKPSFAAEPKKLGLNDHACECESLFDLP